MGLLNNEYGAEFKELVQTCAWSTQCVPLVGLEGLIYVRVILMGKQPANQQDTLAKLHTDRKQNNKPMC